MPVFLKDIRSSLRWRSIHLLKERVESRRVNNCWNYEFLGPLSPLLDALYLQHAAQVALAKKDNSNA